MKNKISISFAGVLMVVALMAVWAKSTGAIKQAKNSSVLALKVNSEKQTYVLGELIKLNFELSNEGDKAVRVAYKPDVSTGYLKIWIAFDDREFNLYNNSSWGRMENRGLTLQPGQHFKSQATIFWNSKPQIPRSGEGKILTDYAFSKAGIYFIKAVASITGDNPMKIESEPIQIVVNEPVGDDLKVWNQIKENGDIAYFIQQGETPTYQDEKAEKLLKEIEQITGKYPNSDLAGQMKQKLEKFRIDEEKRKEMLEKARVKPKN